MKKNVIGVLGGMGPEASLLLYQDIIRHFQLKHNAIQDIDFPHLIINSIGLDGFDETGICDSKKVLNGLIDGIFQLEAAGADHIVMACNTVHSFYSDLQEQTKGIIINLVKETVEKVKREGHTKVLILGSQTTNDTCLYDSYFNAYDIDFFKLNSRDQAIVNQCIKNVMQNNVLPGDVEYIDELIKKHEELGVTATIAACTELPLITREVKNNSIFDTLSILTELVDVYS